VDLHQKVITAFQLRGELFELEMEQARISEKISEREKDTSPDLLNFWMQQVDLINRTKSALSKQLNSCSKNELEELYDQTKKLLEHADEINSKIINELTTENLTQLKIKEHCKQLMNSSLAGLLMLNDFLVEVTTAINAEDPEYLEQVLKEVDEAENDQEV
jgi:hypothetical protein